jgi:uncharacterized protein YegP (UPF0339 family)
VTRTVVFYADRHHEWRWKVRASNGRVLADSGEGYKELRACKKMARSLFPQIDLRRGTSLKVDLP